MDFNSLPICSAKLCPFLCAIQFCLLDGPWPNTKVHGNGTAELQFDHRGNGLGTGSLRS